MNVPDGLRYSSDHEWVKVDGNVALIGITDYAQDALGDVVYVDLPAAGTVMTAAESFGEVESTKSVSELYAPISGEIAAVNDALADEPEKLNADPYGEGWIIRVEMSNPTELDGLIDADAYRALIDG
ncbi:MAG: glycine cleavage system H protein [Candidatus Aldehydirespiratoraceae bacterium]|jgi:glycine cleavage system H protein